MPKTQKPQIDPKDIKHTSTRERLQKAIDLKQQIDRLIDQQPTKLKDKLVYLTGITSERVTLIYQLSQQIDAFENNPIIQRDRVQLPHKLEGLKAKLAHETNANKRTKLQNDVNICEKLMANLQKISENVEKIHRALDEALSQLNHVYDLIRKLDVHITGSAKS